jgi:FtsH-binding integral membrane protein
MSYDSYQPQTTRATTGTDIDAGLQTHMRSVYNTMTLGLGFTGAVAYGVAILVQSNEAFRGVFLGPLFFLFAFAPLGFLFFGFTPGRMARWPASKIQTMFYVFAATMGVSMATIFLAYSGASIARVFFITAGTFAATSLYGYTTKRDLTGMGSFLMMGLIGIFLAAIVNMFLGSSTVQFVVSVLGIVVFTGLAAWETQRIKESYNSAYNMAEANAKMAVMGALGLYLNFINLFQSLLHLMGNRE